jgi:hypothetical protein
LARCHWLTLVILATWEAGIRRIAVQGQPRENSFRDSIQSVAGHSGMCLSSQATWEGKILTIVAPGQPSQKTFVRHHFNGKNLDMVVQAWHPSEGRKHKTGGSQSRSVWTKSKIPSLNNQIGWLKCLNSSLASSKTGVQTPVLPKSIRDSRGTEEVACSGSSGCSSPNRSICWARGR